MPFITRRTLYSLALVHVALSTPLPPDSSVSAGMGITGTGGHAAGGSVTTTGGSSLLGGLRLIDVLSHNAGKGGFADSGDAYTSGAGGVLGGSGKKLSFLGGPGGLGLGGIGGGRSDSDSHIEANNAYSGMGGNVDGGSVTDPGGALISVLSGNAGNAGHASSGSAEVGTKAYKSFRMRQSRMWLSTKGRQFRSRMITRDSDDQEESEDDLE